MNRLRTRLRAGGSIIPGPALILLFSGQSNAVRRASQVTTDYPARLFTFNGAAEASDRTDGFTVTAPLPASYFTNLQAFSEFGDDAESLGPGYAYVAEDYNSIVTFSPAIGSRHWRELMPGTGSWANLQQALIRGRVLLNARAATSIDVVNIIDHGEADSDDVAPGGGADGGTAITIAEYKTILQHWTEQTQKNAKWAFADATKEAIIAGTQICITAGGGYRNVQNAYIEAAEDIPGFYLIGPRYWAAYETDGTHVTGAGKRQVGEYIAHRIADIEAGIELPVYMTGATRVADTVTITTNTISGNLVIDTTNVPETTTSFSDSKNGFQVRRTSDGSTVNITACSVSGTAITLTLAADPGEAVEIRYAQMDWPGGNQAVTGVNSKLARGNIRDSGTRTSLYDGSTLYNWLCHQSIETN